MAQAVGLKEMKMRVEISYKFVVGFIVVVASVVVLNILVPKLQIQNGPING